MEISKINTSLLIEEKKTDGHSPMHFLCDDGNNYYVKYLIRRGELNFLLFELIGSILCKHQNIPTPDFAFVKIVPHSYAKRNLDANKKLLKDNVIAFGSKEIPAHDLFIDFYNPETKSDFNKFINPYDIVKIALLDLWILNKDRKEGRYNFIFQNTDAGKKIYAIDHAFSFGGVIEKHFLPSDLIHTSETLLNSMAFRKFLKFMNKETISLIIDDFSYLCNNDSKKLLDSLFKQIPSEWGIESSLINRIFNFLYNKERLTKLKLEASRILLS